VIKLIGLLNLYVKSESVREQLVECQNSVLLTVGENDLEIALAELAHNLSAKIGKEG
jgi:hypothetical protein